MTTTHTSLVRKLWFREVGNSPKVTQDTVGENPGPSSFKACALFRWSMMGGSEWSVFENLVIDTRKESEISNSIRIL